MADRHAQDLSVRGMVDVQRPTGEDTKAAIREVALAEFVVKGYDEASLEQIATEVGITRSAILHHFGSKAELLREIVHPFDAAIDDIFAAYADSAVPLSVQSRKALLTAFVNIYCEHRLVLLMLLRDISSHWPIHISPQMDRRLKRTVQLLAGDQPTSIDRVVVDAVLGVITRPLIDPATDTDDEHVRRLIVTLAVDVAKRLGNEASRSWNNQPTSPKPTPRAGRQMTTNL